MWIAQEIGNKDLFLFNFKSRITDIFKQQWKAKLAEKPKLRTYCQFRTLLEPERYLLSNCNWNQSQTFACFRTSSLPLAIEEGRHHNVDPTERLCNICKQGYVEDEYHFLLVCPVYDMLRKEYLPQTAIHEPNLCKFNNLMRTKNTETIFKLCNYVF